MCVESTLLQGPGYVNGVFVLIELDLDSGNGSVHWHASRGFLWRLSVVVCVRSFHSSPQDCCCCEQLSLVIFGV